MAKITNKQIEKADDILCPTELTTEQQIEAIMNCKDDSEMVDYIDGVQVCEMFEWTFTVKDFLIHLGIRVK